MSASPPRLLMTGGWRTDAALHRIMILLLLQRNWRMLTRSNALYVHEVFLKQTLSKMKMVYLGTKWVVTAKVYNSASDQCKRLVAQEICRQHHPERALHRNTRLPAMRYLISNLSCSWTGTGEHIIGSLGHQECPLMWQSAKEHCHRTSSLRSTL